MKRTSILLADDHTMFCAALQKLLEPEYEVVGCVGDGGCDEEGLRRAVQLEVLCGMGESVVSDEGGDVGELGLLGLEEFATGRRVEEEIADGDGGAGGKAGVFDAVDVAASDLDYGAGVVFWGTGFEGQAGDAGNGWEGFAAEPEGGDRQEIVGGAELAGGVAFKREESIVLDHAVAVVGDTDELAAAGFDFDTDAGGSGIEGVFEELFDDGGGTLDDFAGSDLVGYQVGEDADAAHTVDCMARGMCGKRGRNSGHLMGRGEW